MLKYGKERQFKENTVNFLAERLLAPNEEGISRIVSIEEFEKLKKETNKRGLGFGNGGGFIRKDGSFCMKYKVRSHRTEGMGNSITGIQTIGYAESLSTRSSIPEFVRNAHRGKCCVFLGIGTGENDIDHKDGYSEQGSDIDDFQPASAAANSAKRDFCKKCKETGKRFDAKRLGFSSGWVKGGSMYTIETKCEGCYQYDPVLFRKIISSGFKSIKN